jgi:opacity protein-like surface antigen
MRSFALAVGLLLLLTGMALAADVDGTWTGTISTPGGDMPVSFTFKADGANLTGSTLGMDGNQVPIKDGKIDGNNISFTVAFDMGGQEMKLLYKGVVAPDQIKLSGEAMGQPFEFTVKKAK